MPGYHASLMKGLGHHRSWNIIASGRRSLASSTIASPTSAVTKAPSSSSPSLATTSSAGPKRRNPPAPLQSRHHPIGIYKAPAVHLPPFSRLQELNDKWKLELEESELEALRSSMKAAIGSYQRVAELPDVSPLTVRYPRVPGYRPPLEENPYNAWYYKTEIKGAQEDGGKDLLLKGKTVAVKDCVAVSGVPMMNGSRILEGYTPEFDATVVTRVLDAGGTIAGKAVAEDLCCSGSSFATALGPVRNPYNEKYAAGGSSSGCGALLGGNVVDMAIGTDQGGSIRIPASWCGVVGLKPTFGLVPFTGTASHEFTVDHVGPMAGTAMDTALLLEAIAGKDDDLDARQDPQMPATLPKYSKLVTGEVKGLKVGVLQEGLEGCEEDVQAATLQAAEALRQGGASVERISIPLHSDSASIWLPLCLEGGHATRMEGAGVGLHHKGYYPVSLQQAYARGFQLQAAELSYTNKFYMLFGEYVKETYGHVYYAKCQNLCRLLRQAYDQVLVQEKYDIILMPTLPLKPTFLLGEGADAEAFIAKAWCMLQNTAAADLTGHPAISVPCGFDRNTGLPHGTHLVGRMMEDATVLNVASVIERACAANEF